MRLGLRPTLAVRGRKTGEWRVAPVNVLQLDGSCYLVAPRGETQWARNLRVTGEGELRRRGKTERFRAEEIEDIGEKERLIAAYRERWDKETRTQFEALPDPVDHPVFRIESLE